MKVKKKNTEKKERKKWRNTYIRYILKTWFMAYNVSQIKRFHIFTFTIFYMMTYKDISLGIASDVLLFFETFIYTITL